ncbi:MAG TPA: SIS domain-containing protein [Candidatus Acidoferrales bacterium]|nr:SIS domain-containing protein [Candidatus Acidoferrales bacterium]
MTTLGVQFEREIYDQPAVWRRLAASGRAQQLAASLDDATIFLGSGSSLFAAQLGALALRRGRLGAHALAATEARIDHRAYQGRTVVAISQSGRSTDLFEAVEALAPRLLVALTNTASSPLGERADIVVDIEAGTERAVPASKSVTATVALVLWAASLLRSDATRDAAVLTQTADAVENWLHSPLDELIGAAQRIARRASVVVLGSGYGLPIAHEMALKLKEGAYLHAEGYAAGEFRHGSVAMVDASFAAIGIVDEAALPVVARPLREVRESEALCYALGSTAIDDIPLLGPVVEPPFNTLAWLVAAQLIALHAGRARHIDSDSPRGLSKALITEA